MIGIPWYVCLESVSVLACSFHEFDGVMPRNSTQTHDPQHMPYANSALHELPAGPLLTRRCYHRGLVLQNTQG